MNRVNLIGRITREPEIKEYGKDNDIMCHFTLAVQRDKDNANFIPCSAFDKVAENMEKYVQKGDLLGVEGRLRDYSYENKDGEKVYGMEVSVDRLYFLQAKKERDEADDGDYGRRSGGEKKGGRRR